MPMNKTLMRLIGSVHTSLYKISGGKLGRNIRSLEFVLLTTTGRKSGKQRTTPLLGVADDVNWTLIASQGGHPQHPNWYLNLRDNPDVELQVGGEKKRMRAETAKGEDRVRLWAKMTETHSGYDEYQSFTKRVIPVVVLRPAEVS